MITVGALYAVTWVGGLIVYPRDMERRAQEEYAMASATDRRMSAESEESRRYVEKTPAAFPDGPKAVFHWAVPLAPAILVVSSEYHIGPLWGHGGVRLVLFYGVGTLETPPIFGWIS